MEDRISMATKRQITLRFKDEYAKASKKDKGVILDRMCETLKIGRSTARRRLKEAGRAGEGREAPRERPKRYSDRSRLLLEQVWLLMDLPCAKYMKEMLPQWIPTLLEAGELRGFDTATVDELLAMSAATMDRYLKPVRDAANPKGMASTRPAGELLRNSITIRKAGDELDGLPGNVEADTVAHCGPSLKGEFCRTLTVVDFATGWTENASARNNAYRNLSKAEAVIEERLPFAIRSYDNDNGSEFINLDFISHLQAIDVEQTRSRPYRKNDQATVESRNNHIVRRHAFYYRYEPAELDLLNELWELVRIKANLFTPSKKPVGRASTRDGRPKRVYDQPVTPWESLKRFDDEDRAKGGPGFIKPGRRERIERLIAETNPAELVRRIHAIQDELEQAAMPRTKRLERKLGPDMAYLNKTLARITGADVSETDDEPAGAS